MRVGSGGKPNFMSQWVTPQYLLEGAAYALQQSGFLLLDANALYRSGAYASTVVLAAFGREELGRWKLLLKLRKAAIGGKQLSLDDVKTSCGDHVTRQRAGALSITFRGDGSSTTGKLFRDYANAVPGSDQWKAAKDAVDDFLARKRKRLPEDRHLTRMAALYVDPISLTDWNRPADKITKNFAWEFLIDASNEYSLQQSQGYSELEIVAIKDPDLAEALKKWNDRPVMVSPEWPPL